MRFQDLEMEGYKLGLRHNPKHFYPNSFRLEATTNGRILVTARAKRHSKPFKVVGVLRPVKNSV